MNSVLAFQKGFSILRDSAKVGNVTPVHLQGFMGMGVGGGVLGFCDHMCAHWMVDSE